MRARVPLAFSAAAPAALASLLLASLPARAHQSWVATDLQAGSSALSSGALSAQFGFTDTSPLFVRAELSHTSVPEGSRDDSTIYSGEAGYEGLHFGFAAHYGTMSSGDDPSFLNYNWAGGTLFYRWVPWVMLTTHQELELSREDRVAELKRMRREMDEAIPMATLMGLTLDAYNISTPIGISGGQEVNHFGAYVRWRVKPFWTFFPKADFFTYQQPIQPFDLGVRSYSSRALRLVRFGLDGPVSGIFGAVRSSYQLYSIFHLVPLLNFTPALTLTQVAAPSATGFSLWLGFDRYVGDSKKWLVSPSYEHYFFNGSMYSFFMVRVKYEINPPYIPPAD